MPGASDPTPFPQPRSSPGAGWPSRRRSRRTVPATASDSCSLQLGHARMTTNNSASAHPPSARCRAVKCCRAVSPRPSARWRMSRWPFWSRTWRQRLASGRRRTVRAQRPRLHLSRALEVSGCCRDKLLGPRCCCRGRHLATWSRQPPGRLPSTYRTTACGSRCSCRGTRAANYDLRYASIAGPLPAVLIDLGR